MKPIFVIKIAGTELNRHPTEPLATINFANTSVALPVSFTAILLSRVNYTIKEETACTRSSLNGNSSEVVGNGLPVFR